MSSERRQFGRRYPAAGEIQERDLSEDSIQITLTIGQVAALVMAADLFTRISMGQVDELALIILRVGLERQAPAEEIPVL